jgi:osmoprotectant transport system permease protein
VKNILLVCSLVFSSPAIAAKPTIAVGSKVFTEGYIVSEIIAQTIEHAGEVQVVRKFGLGGTGIVYEALTEGSIDIYPEYSGTITETILKSKSASSLSELKREVETIGLIITNSLGFNDTYALAMNGKLSRERKIFNISDLNNFPDIRVGLSHEFLKRSDGYPGLTDAYKLKLQNVKGLEHSLAYEAIERGEIDLTDAYSTDAKIERFKLRVLDDDLHFFPDYFVVALAKRDFAIKFPKSWLAVKKLEESISEDDIRSMNAASEIDKKEFSDIASQYLYKRSAGPVSNSVLRKVWTYTKQHLALVGISLFLSILVGLPLGILAARYRKLGRFILITSGLLQTIPSLALLCFLIPFFGIGTIPSLIALFLYGLLPIVINTDTALISIDGQLIESARALGLSRIRRLLVIELPLASPGIMVGIKTSAIINIGTATLAALIGAGGYGTPIVTGLALNDVPTILQGAVPAALMSLVAFGLFELVNRVVIPKGLR